MVNKLCSKCEQSKLSIEFYKDSSKKDGLTSYCKPCRILSSKERVDRNKDLVKAHKAAYYLENKETIDSRNHLNYQNNKDKYKVAKDIYREVHKERFKIWFKNHSKEKRKYYNHISAKRRAAKLNQTPKWADLKAIEEFYKNCPKGYSVDHIIPLQGKNVRGLHVLENLQYLTKSENSRKGNRV